MHPRRTTGVVIVALVSVVLLSTGCASGTGASSRPPGQSAPAALHAGRGMRWIATGTALAGIMTDATASAVLRRGMVYELVGSSGATTVPGAVATVTYDSEAQLAAAAAAGAIPHGVGAVLYDDEAWPFTPVSEQRAPVPSTRAAAAVARRNGWVLLASPALDLVGGLDTAAASRWQGYLDAGLAGKVAPWVDVLDVQAQSLERDTTTYARFVSEAAHQARAANAHVEVVAGLSTNPSGAPVTLAELEDDVTATAGTVGGYWLNVPGPGPRCPTCGSPRPQLAAALLDWIGG